MRLHQSVRDDLCHNAASVRSMGAHIESRTVKENMRSTSRPSITVNSVVVGRNRTTGV